jgi:hypothetical protein
MLDVSESNHLESTSFSVDSSASAEWCPPQTDTCSRLKYLMLTIYKQLENIIDSLFLNVLYYKMHDRVKIGI